ncbi:HET-domain-containing protein [Plenodomus tracheiphilus IPT5]|uniref:HET-domain-containing protein n=1 Tax=Plenodomus tracheiphilus IPT5 TaxID=1408161 RepID=A0A6A7BNA7_9PLEO|nr:HET-domain-containing protein [Plenodomus tracheiphilus IPT5]
METEPRIHKTLSQLQPQTTSDFRYRPLDHSNGESVRLVCLLPGDYQDQLCCELFHANLDLDIDYEAVSYTWATEAGDASLSESIACGYLGEENRTRLWVTENCASALRRLRQISEPRILWIDIIAINQSDPEEKNHQVALMAQIYSQASQVLVYLGEEDLGFGINGIWLDSEKRLVALKKLFAKRWASRVWVIQEVALAQKLTMITGEVSIRMDAHFMTRVRGRARASGLLVPGPLAWDPLVSAPSRDLLTMLHMSRNCHSTDPRDKVYSLLGLTGERLQSLIEVDYSQSIEEVLTRASVAIILFREDFEVLAYATSTLGAGHADRHLPTWVPDWTGYREEKAFTPQFKGRKIGPWRSLNKDFFQKKLADDEGPNWDAVVTMLDWTTGPVSHPYLTLRAHCIGNIDHTVQDSNGPTGLNQPGMSAHIFRHRLLDLVSRDVGTNEWPPEYRWLVEGASAQRRLFEVRSEHAGPERLTSFERVDVESFCEELARLGENKYVFRAGYLPAIASAGFERGDYVYAIDGCTTPLILRRIGTQGLWKFRIIGSAYLLSLAHLDCWVTVGSGLKQQWDFDPFRRMNAQGTQMIEIY